MHIIQFVTVVPGYTVFLGKFRIFAGDYKLVCVGYDARMRGIFELRNAMIAIRVTPNFAKRVMCGKVEGLERQKDEP